MPDGVGRLLAARGWSRTGQGVMRSREGVPELVGLHLWQWRRETWLHPEDHMVVVLERGLHPTGRRRWLVGSPDELTALGIPPGPDTAPPRPAPTAPRTPISWASPRPRGSWKRPDRRFLAALPDDPDALLAALLDAHPPTRFLGALEQTATILASGLFPEPVVAALVAALHTRPDVEVLTDVADPCGRACTVLREHLNGTVHDLLLDPARCCYRGYQEHADVDCPLPVPAGTLLGGDVLVARDNDLDSEGGW